MNKVLLETLKELKATLENGVNEALKTSYNDIPYYVCNSLVSLNQLLENLKKFQEPYLAQLNSRKAKNDVYLVNSILQELINILESSLEQELGISKEQIVFKMDCFSADRKIILEALINLYKSLIKALKEDIKEAQNTTL